MDHWLTLKTARKENFTFAVGIDRDGVPSAPQGYVRNWSPALD